MLTNITLFKTGHFPSQHWGLALLALMAPAVLPAQEPETLQSLVIEALRNNLGLQGERLSHDKSTAEVREARAYFFPSLSFDSRYSRQSGVLNLGDFVNPAYAAINRIQGTNQFPTNLDLTLPFTYESRIRVTQTLFNESIRRNYRLARHREEGQASRVRTAARKLAADVQAAAVLVADARSAVRIYQASLELVTENERVTTRLLEAGRATPDAVFRARAERSHVEQSLAEANERVNAASRSLNQLVGRPLDTAVPALADSSLLFGLAITAEEAVRHGLAHRDELAELDAGIGAADEAVGLATASFLPSLSLAIDYGFQGQQVRVGSGNDFRAVSVVMSWTPFNGGRDLARRQAALAETERATTARRDAENRISLEVRQAFEAATVARSAITTADDRLGAARRTFELVRRRYQEGLASQIEFLDARTQLTNAELNRALTAHRYALRYFELERAAALRPTE